MKNDGGPAFPANTLNVPLDKAGDPQYQGMTLRDYLAAKAMQGGISTANGLGGLDAASLAKVLGDFSRICYAVADAMLAERAK